MPDTDQNKTKQTRNITATIAGCWVFWSGKRGSNPRPSAWKADALPSELFPHPENVVGREGFEPPKAEPTDLQSAPFDRSGTSPRISADKADGGIRTPDLLITSEPLWPPELHRRIWVLKGSDFLI